MLICTTVSKRGSIWTFNIVIQQKCVSASTKVCVNVFDFLYYPVLMSSLPDFIFRDLLPSSFYLILFSQENCQTFVYDLSLSLCVCSCLSYFLCDLLFQLSDPMFQTEISDFLKIAMRYTPLSISRFFSLV